MTRSTYHADRFDGGVPAALPLALLEAVRAHDLPDEILEDENLTESLPRRLGLTGVVFTQIQRFEAAQRAGKPVRLDEVVPLVRLVLRRPDAALIMEDTGRRFALWFFEKRSAAMKPLYPKLPSRLSSMAAAHAIRRALKQLHAGAPVAVTRQPLHVRIERCLTARIDASGAACPLITGLVRQLHTSYTGRDIEVEAVRCGSDGQGTCEWAATHSATVATPA